MRFNGKKLERARGSAYTAAEVASVASVTRQTVRNWEQGRGEPSGAQALLIAALLGRPVDWFYEGGSGGDYD